MLKKLLVIIGLLAAPAALAQSVQQSGAVTRNHIPYWVTSGAIGDGGTSADSPISSIGVTNEGGIGFQICSGRLTAAGRNCLGFSASTTGPATISLQNYGTAQPQALNYNINGTVIAIPTGGGSFIFGNPPFTTGNVPCFLNNTGTLQDCGLALNNGTITVGTWQGTPVGILFGGTGSNNAAGARVNLGLGTIATQNANAVALTGGTITGMPTPVNASDVAIKSYVDATATGLNVLAPSALATTTVLPNTPTYANGTLGVGATLTAATNTTLTVDGSAATLNTVVLVKNQAAPAQNGIYQVTTAGSGSAAWVLTRVTYFDQAAEMKAGSYTFVTAGSTNINTAFVLQASVTTVGTDPLNFVQFSAGATGTVTSATIAAGTGISVTGTCTITTNGTCTINNTGLTSLVLSTGLLGGTVTTTGTAAVDPTIINSQGGRLTLVSGQPYMTTDCVGCQTIYLAPDTGEYVPVYTGSAWTLNCFLSACPSSDNAGILSLALGGSSSWPANSIFDLFAVLNSGTLTLASRAWDSAMLPTTSQLANNTTITTNTTPTAWVRPTAAFDGLVVKSGTTSANVLTGNPGLANCIGQNFGSPQIVTSTIITAPTDHFILSNNGTTDIRTFGSTDGTNFVTLSVNWINDAIMGASYTLPILFGNQRPYQYWLTCFDNTNWAVTPSVPAGANVWIAQIQYQTTTAPSTRRLVRYGGIQVNDNSMTSRISSSSTITTGQYQGTYLGTFQTDPSNAGQVTVNFSYGPSRSFNLWNAYRQADIVLQSGVTTDVSNFYTLTNQQFSPCENSTFSATALIGLAQSPVTVHLQRTVTLNTLTPTSPADYEAGIGMDTITAISSVDASTNFDSNNIVHGLPITADLVIPPYAGTHTLYCIERSGDGSTGGTVTPFTGYRETFMHTKYKG